MNNNNNSGLIMGLTVTACGFTFLCLLAFLLYMAVSSSHRLFVQDSLSCPGAVKRDLTSPRKSEPVPSETEAA